VFRFTLGIPGVDDAVIPRVVGLAGAALLWANHAFSVAPSAAQHRAEWLGVLLCAASVVVPSLDERLNEVRVRVLRWISVALCCIRMVWCLLRNSVAYVGCCCILPRNMPNIPRWEHLHERPAGVRSLRHTVSGAASTPVVLLCVATDRLVALLPTVLHW